MANDPTGDPAFEDRGFLLQPFIDIRPGSVGQVDEPCQPLFQIPFLLLEEIEFARRLDLVAGRAGREPAFDLAQALVDAKQARLDFRLYGCESSERDNPTPISCAMRVTMLHSMSIPRAEYSVPKTRRDSKIIPGIVMVTIVPSTHGVHISARKSPMVNLVVNGNIGKITDRKPYLQYCNLR
ncbi:MAG TPA: hypothetical protein VND87_00640 [Stellaceae bacterium]|nr:hypothetical protein [Stellaceae bacterium]